MGIPSIAPAAQAADASGPFSGGVSLTSDYRFRGYSLSDEEPALQGGLTLNLPQGVYLGVWGSSIADYAGADIEFDLMAGVAFSASAIDISAGPALSSTAPSMT
jgi:uncharacterized protein (TIGR02001 family)